MPTVVQFRRGTTAQNNAFTGAAGELSVDTTLGTIRVHNGVAGGNTLASIDAVQTLSNKTLATPTITGTLSSNGLINTSGNIICASISAGTYVGLSSQRINQDASNVIVTTSFVNIAVNGTNVAAFSSQSLSLTGFLNVSGNVLGSTASFGAINSTGFINTSGNVSAAVHTGGAVSVTGFINTSGNVSAATVIAGAITSTGFINTAGNVSAAVVNTGALNVTGTSTVAAINSTGFINTSANVSAAIGSFNSITVRATVTAIANGGTNGVGNIGATGATFNTVFAKATTAQYADLAEVYTSDQPYPAGTVVVFGGEAEVTQSHSPNDPRIAGVVSTNPAYLMNHDAVGVPVALQGRVPCRVLGPVSKGDRIVASHIAGVAQALDLQQYQPGCIIGKALQAIDSTDISTIEVVVGRV